MTRPIASKVPSRRQPQDKDAVPDDIARALDASAEDLRLDRTEDVDRFLRDMEAKLARHSSGKPSGPR